MSNIGFEESSEYYKNTEFFTGHRTVKVLLENIQDAEVWNDALPVKENLYFEFGTAIDVADELGIKIAEGCGQLNKIKHYHLGENLIICRDSDFSYLAYLMRNIIAGETPSNNVISDYIFDTVVHSMENIVFYKDYVMHHFANRANLHISSISVKAPWINNFYINFSNLIYSPLIKFIYHDFILHKDLKLKQNGFKIFGLIFTHMKNIPMRNLSDFNNFYESKIWKKIVIDIETYENSLDQIILSHNKVEEIDIILQSLPAFGINKEDFYHFFRGHDIADIFDPIFKKYLKLIYENEISLICSKLEGNRAINKRRELEKGEKEFDVFDENRDLTKHHFFKKTFDRLAQLYE
ncbi:hypothetical protein [Acinetobacter baumannii]|uniref:hypothetical protein n=2 Tax=Acinetobacter baumannii TaxID=470 RepID=UPI0023404C63|nr:DUF4435 domain-containing protein [Acinetobacter baumannii]MDO7395362.1 hypothetical protein [Acinetobacter baumannii]HCJ0884371.1 hypothetical protein [Acinetobacter baumannii]HDJ7843326.1 hypothetical protein [Acinetobacter baumannii]HDK8949257.1 hypothetical protein [Acinetobacter baumannii]